MSSIVYLLHHLLDCLHSNLNAFCLLVCLQDFPVGEKLANTHTKKTDAKSSDIFFLKTCNISCLPGSPAQSSPPNYSQFVNTRGGLVQPSMNKMMNILKWSSQIKSMEYKSPCKLGKTAIKQQMFYTFRLTTKIALVIPSPNPFKEIVFGENDIPHQQPQEYFNLEGHFKFPNFPITNHITCFDLQIKTLFTKKLLVPIFQATMSLQSDN